MTKKGTKPVAQPEPKPPFRSKWTPQNVFWLVLALAGGGTAGSQIPGWIGPKVVELKVDGEQLANSMASAIGSLATQTSASLAKDIAAANQDMAVKVAAEVIDQVVDRLGAKILNPLRSAVEGHQALLSAMDKRMSMTEKDNEVNAQRMMQMRQEFTDALKGLREDMGAVRKDIGEINVKMARMETRP